MRSTAFSSRPTPGMRTEHGSCRLKARMPAAGRSLRGKCASAKSAGSWTMTSPSSLRPPPPQPAIACKAFDVERLGPMVRVCATQMAQTAPNWRKNLLVSISLLYTFFLFPSVSFTQLVLNTVQFLELLNTFQVDFRLKHPNDKVHFQLVIKRFGWVKPVALHLPGDLGEEAEDLPLGLQLPRVARRHLRHLLHVGARRGRPEDRLRRLQPPRGPRIDPKRARLEERPLALLYEIEGLGEGIEGRLGHGLMILRPPLQLGQGCAPKPVHAFEDLSLGLGESSEEDYVVRQGVRGLEAARLGFLPRPRGLLHLARAPAHLALPVLLVPRQQRRRALRRHPTIAPIRRRCHQSL
mmetsp:Transcript_13821/g.34742  ORF Transcript_13821/g.34742 Transcript_13821/m.34742 type:complete len:352 (+) Transcript_13821:350-1405(+)